jgi:hypothetical protein
MTFTFEGTSIPCERWDAGLDSPIRLPFQDCYSFSDGREVSLHLYPGIFVSSGHVGKAAYSGRRVSRQVTSLFRIFASA